MNVVIVCKSDLRGGAAVVSYRLMEALRHQGVNASMLVCEKLSDSPHVHLAASPLKIKYSFYKERLRIFMTRGVTRANLFKIDTASDGLPIYRHPLVREADVICLNWVNQGMLSLSGLRKLQSLGKPIVWTMHDMWNFTGVCHHAAKCRRFEKECGDCPLLGKGASPKDISHFTLLKKFKAYREAMPVDADKEADGKSESPIHFVAVSNWLANLARRSTLLASMPVSVIPNAFPIPGAEFENVTDKNNKKSLFRILFGAARLDDSVKGLPILVEAAKILNEEYHEEAKNIELVTFGDVADPSSLQGIGLRHNHIGRINPDKIPSLYAEAQCVVSTSHYETLPGTLVEGQVYGCIPVAFDRGGQSDIVTHLDTGYLAQWDDDIRKAARNIAEGVVWALKQEPGPIKERMLKSARLRFDAPKVARKYMELFANLGINS